MSADQPTRYSFKRDQYARARGASQFLNLSCAACGGFVLLYQKDGPGALLRLYLDRIFAPSPFNGWQQIVELASVPNLNCPHCGALIGSPMVYQPESRLAIRLVRGTFSKTRSNGTYTPPSTPEPSES